MTQRIGFDIGGVIAPSRNDIKDMEDSLKPNADILARMKLNREQGHHLFIISFCGPKRVASSMKFLSENDIVPTLVTFENVYFIGNDKCAKIGLANYLKLDLFIDDNAGIVDVLYKGSQHIGNKRFKRWLTAPGTIGLHPGEWIKWSDFMKQQGLEWDELLRAPYKGKSELYGNKF